MRQRVLAALGIVACLATSSAAARGVLTGGAVSSTPGISVYLRLRITAVSTAGFVGVLKCRPGTARCLWKRGTLSVGVEADGSFAATDTNPRGSCLLEGYLTADALGRSGMAGRYVCGRNDGAGDTGTFQLTGPIPAP